MGPASARVRSRTLNPLRGAGPGAIAAQGSATIYVTGLTAGSTTFTAKYDVTTGTGTFVNRTIIIVPLP